MKSNPNIILIMTDQQRFDTINALGFKNMITPNIDRLVREGTSFSQCFCTSPACVPSRSSFFTGQYPHNNDVYHNYCPWGTSSWVSQLNNQGYHCVNVGKMHTVPYDEKCGFDQRFIVENKIRPLNEHRPHGGFYDEWDKFLANSGIEKPSKIGYKSTYEGYNNALGAYEWKEEEKYHPDIFTANMARWFIERREANSPLFMQIGFPGPHPPYDPPQRFVDMYDDVEFSADEFSEKEMRLQPNAQRILREGMIENERDAVHWKLNPRKECLSRMRKYYAANVTLIDEQIGSIMKLLEEKGYLENAVVVFTSDHGDALGDHGHIQKWTMYDCVTRVPMILWSPERIPAGKTANGLLQQFDVAKAILELAGVEFFEPFDAISVLPEYDGKRKHVFCEHSQDNILEGCKYMTMVRESGYKLVRYLDSDYGELYDLNKDPSEHENLWSDIKYVDTKLRLLNTLVDFYTESTYKKSKLHYRR